MKIMKYKATYIHPAGNKAAEVTGTKAELEYFFTDAQQQHPQHTFNAQLEELGLFTPAKPWRGTEAYYAGEELRRMFPNNPKYQE